MKNKNYLYTVGLVFLSVMIVHILRIGNEWRVLIGDFTMPIWASYFGVVLAGILSYFGFVLGKRG